ncbi:hypothetical protein CTAYLR_003017 [Chrysophaeum taylorii]|uniref:Uncharacterized protein n=1 Tax=Chrysophaeum taylorii TaxID=2483200 RepID=A0AAD7U535_9STRA|nr:hypothetical protein CTAYLR_003017 [Chrysophaeum taylorii]
MKYAAVAGGRRRSVLRYADSRDLAYACGAFVASVISGANQPAQLVIFGNLLDSFNEASTAKAVRLVQFFALLYVVVGVQQFVTVTVQAAAATRVAASQARKVRDAYLTALLAKSIAWFDAEDQGAVAASILESTLAIQDGLGEKLATGVQGASAFLIGIAVSLYYAWSLALVTIAILPVVGGLLGVASSVRARADRAAADSLGKAAGTALETLTRVRTVAAFGGEGRALEAYASATKEVAARNLRLAVATGLNSAAVAACLYATWAVGLWYGAYLVRRDARSEECTYRDDETPAESCVTGGDVMTAFLCVLFGGLSLLQALPGLAAFDAARSAAGRVFDVVDDDREVADVGSSALALKRGAIVFEGVRFAYPSRPDREIYQGLDLTLQAGKSTALVGPSGCGKSTVVQLLLRFYEPAAGRILIDGVDIKTVSASSLRAHFGLVSQEPTLFRGSVADNVAYGKERSASREEIVEAAKLANAHDFVAALPDGYDTQIDGSKLSGGQKQRIAIARALVRLPRCVLLDEATSALDAKSEKVVQAALETLIGDRTTLVIAHRLSTVRGCDSIVVLGVNGRVVERGTHEELMKDPDGHYYALATAQMHPSSSSAAEDDETTTTDVTEVTAGAPVAVVADGRSVDDDDAAAVAAFAEGERENDVEDQREARISNKEVITWVWGMTGERVSLGVGLVGAVISGLTQPLVGYLMAEFIGVFFETSRPAMARKSTFWALMFLCLGGGATVGEVAKSWGLGRITEKVCSAARVASFEAIIRQDVGWHDVRGAGTLASRLATDCAAVKALVGQRLAQTLAMGVIVVGGLAVSFDASWRLTLVTLGIIPIIVLPIVATAAFVSKVGDDDALNAASALASEAILGIRTVRALNLEHHIAADFDECLKRPEQAAIAKGVATGLGGGTAQLSILLGAAFQYYIGSIFFRKGWVNFEDLMTVLLVVIFLAFGLSAVSGDAVDKAEALRAGKRLRLLTLTTSKIDPFFKDNNNYKHPAAAAARLEFRDVCFNYPARPDVVVFDRFSLVVAPGETVALCGESGSGKSTAVQLLLRFYDPTGGRVFLDGVDVKSMAVASLRSQLGLVSQEPTLFAGSVAHNIAYGKQDASRHEIIEAAKLANAHDFVSALPDGYDARVGDQGVQLSGGQKQRVAIARALVRKPRALILDEATSALDPTSERVVQAALDALLHHTKMTTLIIAHRLSTIRDADAIVVMDRGAIVERGTHDALMAARGAYFALVNHATAT